MSLDTRASNRIDVLLTYNAVEDSSRPVIANITHLVSEPIAFTTVAQGGFATSTLTLLCDEVTALSWMSFQNISGMSGDHLGRRIVMVNAFSPYADYIVWEGQIHTVTVDDGKRTIARTINNIYNEVRIDYTEAVVIAGTYYDGEALTTSDADDSTSQTKYGIRELTQTAGVLTEAVADQLRDRLLNTTKNPRSLPGGASVGGGGGQPYRITLDCSGWIDTLSSRFYTTTSTSSSDTNTIIQAVLTSVGQFVSTDYSQMVNSSVSYLNTQAETLTAKDYIDRLVSIGYTSGDLPMFFGLYENAVPYFTVQPTTIKYHIKRFDVGEIIVDATTGATVPPFLVRPGYLCKFIDFAPDGLTYTDPLDDPRTFVIGSVEYRAPNQVRLTPVSGDPSDLVISRIDWHSNMMGLLQHLDGPPQQYVPEPTPVPWWEINYPIPLPGQPIDWGYGDPTWPKDPVTGLPIPDPNYGRPVPPPYSSGAPSGTVPQP